MTTAKVLSNLFPAASDIPEAYRLPDPVEQRDYLVDGQLRIWNGPLAQVRSPIYLTGADGDQQVILGRQRRVLFAVQVFAIDETVVHGH